MSGSLFLSCRDGFIFTLGIDGLQTSGREKQTEEAASIQSLVMCFLATSKMACDTEIFSALTLMETGAYSFL